MTEKEAIIKLKKIEKEFLIRESKNKIYKYNAGEKVHNKQLLFHKCDKKNRWVFGGNRTGKTQCGAVECVWLCRGIHPYKKNKKSVNGWVVSLSSQVQRDVAQEKILYYLNPDWIEEIVMLSGKKNFPENGVIDYILIKNISGQISKLGFKSCDQGREKFQGASLDFVWFDEEPPFDIYLESKMRIIDRSGEIFGTMTPLKGLTWVYNEIYLNKNNDDNVWHIHMDWNDNPFLEQFEIEELTKNMTIEQLESRKFGKFTGGGGLVYPEFDENINVIEPFNIPYDWQDNISIDPGLKNPLSAHWYAVDFDGNVYVVAEHYEADKDIVYHSNKIKEICLKLNWHKTSQGYIEALIDSAAMQKTLASSKSVVELFYDNGILVNPKVNKDLFSGIQRVKGYLSTPKLFIFKTCTHLIKEIKSYLWGKADLPIKANDHALDELRYYIMNKPEPAKKEKSDITKNKEKLFRQLKRIAR